MSIKRKQNDDDFEKVELVIDLASFLGNEVKKASKRKYKKRDPALKVDHDKHLASYWKTKPMKVISSIWVGKIIVAAEADSAILPTDHCVPNYLQQEMTAQQEGWKSEGLRDWKLDPTMELSSDAQLWLKTYTVRVEQSPGVFVHKQKWNLGLLKHLIGIHLKTVSVNIDNCGGEDRVLLSLHHIQHFLTKMLPLTAGLETLHKSYQDAWKGYTSDWFDIFGCRGEKILIEMVDNQNCFQEWKDLAKEAKNSLTLELSKQILWNSKRNVGFRMIENEIHIYLLTSISQLNIWNWLLQNKMLQHVLDNLAAIHVDFRDKMNAKKRPNLPKDQEQVVSHSE